MTTILLTLVSVIVLLFGFWLIMKASDSDSLLSLRTAIAVIFWSVIIGLIVIAAEKRETRYPCTDYEIQTRYNPSTKTMLPMKVCVQRGEWVNPDDYLP